MWTSLISTCSFISSFLEWDLYNSDQLLAFDCQVFQNKKSNVNTHAGPGNPLANFNLFFTFHFLSSSSISQFYACHYWNHHACDCLFLLVFESVSDVSQTENFQYAEKTLNKSGQQLNTAENKLKILETRYPELANAKTTPAPSPTSADMNLWQVDFLTNFLFALGNRGIHVIRRFLEVCIF